MSHAFRRTIAALLLTGAFAAGAQANLPERGSSDPQTAATSATPRDNLQVERGKIVAYATSKPAGSIVVDTKRHALFYVLGDGKAVTYPVATAKRGFEWSGTHQVSMKAKWPDWRPPASMRKRRPDLPRFMKGGPDNPLGARAIYLGSSIYRIHGTNEPSSIGTSASSGCIRMLNEDVTELFRLVKIGASVTVL